MALPLPVLRMDRLAMVMPTRSDNSLRLILRLAIMISRLMISAMLDYFFEFVMDVDAALEYLGENSREEHDDYIIEIHKMTWKS